LFLRAEELGLEGAGGASSRALRAPAFGRAAPAAHGRAFHDRLGRVDWVPDLGARVGSAAWWRGAATLAALCWGAWSLAPAPFAPLTGAVDAPLTGEAAAEARALALRPLALGSSVPRALPATDLVRPLASAPERPRVELAVTLGRGDALSAALSRAGVGRGDAAAAQALLAEAAPGAAPEAGTRVSLVLGRRPRPSVPRPLEAMHLRARFDLDVTVHRVGDALALAARAIAVDRTPLRLRGTVGPGLWRSARAAGASPQVVEQLLRALSSRLSLGRDVGSADRFDLVIGRERAATGEERTGDLLYLGLEGARRRLRLVRMESDGGGDGGTDWFDPDGQAERRGTMGLPVAGRISSGFGWRSHPILGFLRLHKGLDIAAPRGAPIYAALDGVVQFAGRSGGYGNFVKLAHGAAIQSGYGHMSRIAVAAGQRVNRGQVIGYVGSTGLSTGPHLHWEVWRAGRPVNPAAISYDRVSRLSGERLRALRARVAQLTALPFSGPATGAP